ncbi:hypothetical protein BDF20DRAFT_902642 [Mycotypha africana]|uniref:uncharacterized protein n=1 Tax=Mycotypha africana TaxID=64632 RepID=UPI0022FFFD2F|nr:uncharacterized protein BDF20DRAFT_902642 [Mycotypha africana]KAI8967110.1 hypothetical protein BDF20DRAFT_902642 [Mycotypha africana]
MPFNIPNLLEGKLLTGVLPPDKQPPLQYFLPHYNTPILSDIESCIDDPALAPLGLHIRKTKRHHKMKKKYKDPLIDYSQVYRENSAPCPANSLFFSLASAVAGGSGLLMLRRRALTTHQLEEELKNLILPFTSYLEKPLNSVQNSIVELDISRNQLTDIPKQVAHFTHLRILNASSNQLATWPHEALSSLTQLEVLILSQNQIKEIPEDIPQRLPNLVTFRIAANSVEKFPDRLDYWKHMRHLQLGSVYGGNRLTHIPDRIADMPVLEELDVSYNQLRYLPHDFHIPTLKILNASHNQLDFIPKSITQCSHLKSLNLSNNHLMSLPADLVSLKHLELLDISENLLCIMPAEILERMQSSNILITGNPLTRPGHCDQKVPGQNAYAQVLKRMMKLGLPRSSSSSALLSSSSPTTAVFHQEDPCGPKGTGCLRSLRSDSEESTGSLSSMLSNGVDSPPSIGSLPPTPPSSECDAPSYDAPLLPHVSVQDIPPPSSYPLLSPHLYQDEDASIDHELSYHARKLNIDGSRPAPQPSYYGRKEFFGMIEQEQEQEEEEASSRDPPHSHLSNHDLLRLSRSSILADSSHLTSDYCYVLDPSAASTTHNNRKQIEQPTLPKETNLFHSLRELATRTVLQQGIDVLPSIDVLPVHLAKDIVTGRTKCRYCSCCQGPFVNEWVTSVQIKSFGGHPAVVRRVRFCSTKCWVKCLPKEDAKSVVCVHH